MTAAIFNFGEVVKLTTAGGRVTTSLAAMPPVCCKIRAVVKKGSVNAANSLPNESVSSIGIFDDVTGFLNC
jgi:hypothetical protein